MDFDLASVERVVIVACGTASYVGMIGKYWIEQFARVPVEVDVASEYRYRDPVLLPNTLGIVVSQSGETADTLAALRHMKANGLTTAGIINVPTSSMAREVDLLLSTHAGPEIGVASTKAFTCQPAATGARGGAPPARRERAPARRRAGPTCRSPPLRGRRAAWPPPRPSPASWR